MYANFENDRLSLTVQNIQKWLCGGNSGGGGGVLHISAFM